MLSFKSTGPFTPPTPGSGDDPSNVGASLQILNPGTSESFTFNLPQAHWSVSGTTFRYVDSALVEAGKVKIAIIGRILKVSGKKIGITLNEPTQGTLDAVFTTGSIRYCASFVATAAASASSPSRPGCHRSGRAAARTPAERTSGA